MDEKDLSLVEFLKLTLVFNGIAEADLLEISALCRTYDIGSGDVLFEQGDTTEGLFFILNGEASLINYDKGKEIERLILKAGDFAGEEAVFFFPKRNNKVVITQPATILYISNKKVARLVETHPQIRENLNLLTESRNLSQKLSFSWLIPDEEIYVISRKHPLSLMSGMLSPLFFYIGLVLLMVLATNFWQSGIIFFLLLLSTTFVFSLSWLGWNVYNWANDYYIVTDRRIVWIQKVAGVFDSRQEAPLITLKTVGTSKSWLGSLLGFADVSVRTFVGPIYFRRVANAAIIAGMIESLWMRSKQAELHDEYGKMEEILQLRLNGEALPSELATEPNLLDSPIDDDPLEATHENSFFEWLFSDFLRLRFEKGRTITYRKHWLILIKNTWRPTLLFAAAVILSSMVLTNNLTFISKNFLLGISGIILVSAAGWLLYNYIDWRNDVYQLSDEQVIDVDRKPLGKENRRTAPLESILSIEHNRKGLLALLFNFGTVLISVGNTELSFDFVSHPSDVQQDIFARMGLQLETRRKSNIKQERERMAEWLKVYHDQVNSSKPANEPDGHSLEATRRLDKK